MVMVAVHVPVKSAAKAVAAQSAAKKAMRTIFMVVS
jgi:hypothetical protein